MRIAIVEDNEVLADGIARAFSDEGHGVDQLHDGAAANEFLIQESVDLIILDINLPGESGLEILRDLRRRQIQTPILILTARDSVADKIDGLDLGADDYMTKPFDLTELQARARALLRRSDKNIANILQFGGVEFDVTAREIRIDGAAIELPRREFALAEILLNRPGHVISKQQIITHLYGAGADVEDSTVELYVHRLRKKFGTYGSHIKTVRGLGYCFREKS